MTTPADAPKPAAQLMLSADQPITSRTQDALRRDRFAADLAKAIASWKTEDSLVIGLYGPWGSGKSSLKNLVLEALRESPSSAPAILEFNPWHWHGHDQVASAFFREVLRAIGRISDDSGQKDLARRMRRYAKFLEVGGAAFEPIRPLVAGAFTVLGLLTLAIPPLLKTEHALTFAKIIGFTLVGLAALMLAGAKVLERLAELIELRTNSGATLEEQKRAIDEALRSSQKPLLVVIDDVDRLSPAEIATVFQLIKANADFPRFIYLVLFQRDIVEHALRDITSESGKYLEKIIQAGFDLPMARREDVEQLLTQNLDALLQSDLQKFDQNHWRRVYQLGLRQYFRTLRDVKRFLGTFGFHLGLLRTEGVLEVNPVDLIALETLRVFEPALHAAMRSSKRLLTGRVRERDDEDHRAQCAQLLERAPVERRDHLRELLRELFPPAARGFGGNYHGPTFDASWLTELRACSAEMFDRYFEYALPPNDVSQAEITQLLALANDGRGLTKELKGFAAEGRLMTALERLQPRVQELPAACVSDVVIALLNLGDVLPEDPKGYFAMPPLWQVMGLITAVLKREEDNDKRDAAFQRAIRETDDLGMAVRAVAWESNAETRRKHPESFAIREHSLKALQQLCVERIRLAGQESKLHTARDLAQMLIRWGQWADPKEARAWTMNSLASTDYGAQILLKAFLETSTATDLTNGTMRVRPYIRLSSIEPFVDLEQLEKLLAKVSLVKVDDNGHRQAIEEFRRAMADRRAGKKEPEFPFPPD